LVEAGYFLQPQNTNGFQHPQRADCIRVCGVFGRLEGDRDMALSGQVVNLIGLHLLNDADEVG
jgi:hypothetical protein